MKLVFFHLCLFLSLACFGQKKGNTATIRSSNGDTAYIRQLLDSAKKLRNVDSAGHLLLTDKALKLAEEANAKSLAAQALHEKAIQETRGEKAIALLLRGLSFANEAADTSQMVSINNFLGFQYSKLKQVPRALDHYFAALRLLGKKSQPRELEFTLTSIGTVYMALEDRRGIDYLEKSLALRYERMRKMGRDSTAISGELTNLSLAYYKFGDTLKAIEFAERGLSVAEKNKAIHNHLFPLLSNLSNFYTEFSEAGLKKAGLTKNNALKKVEYYCEKIFALPRNLVPDNYAGAWFSLGRVSLEKKDYAGGLANFLKAEKIAQDNNFNLMQGKFLREISLAYAGLKQYDSAYKYYQAYFVWKESTNNFEIKRLADRKQTEFEFGKIQDSLQFIQQLTNEKLKQQNLLALQQEQALELKQTLLELNIREKENADLAFEKAASELAVNQSLVKEKEKQLTIAEQEKILQQNKAALQQSQLLVAQKELEAKKRQQLFYIVGIASLLLLFYAFFRNYKNRQQAKAQIAAAKQKAQKAEAVRKMAEFEMHGLRAQLNPHFMFNSLNAIQEQILKQDTDNAGAYLTTFARMLRQLLENAEYSFVSLGKELGFLKLYLSMEQLRMKELQFEMDIDPAIDTETVMIPNMILQPYLENAIWHGLSPKAGRKHICIKIDQAKDHIVVQISDNGVGREKAAELQSRYRKAHKSKGMELLYKRFELIRVEFGSQIKIDIEDLQSDGKVAGTKVSLLIPTSLSEPMAMMKETILHN